MGPQLALHRGRNAAEALMVDTCAITRDGGEHEFDPDTGDYTSPAATSVYAGPCRVRTAALAVRTAELGERDVNLTRVVVSVPITVTGLIPGDVVTITAAANDPELVGRTYHFLGDETQTHATARRLLCEMVA